MKEGVFDQLNIHVIAVSRPADSLRITYINSSALQLLGYPKNELEGALIGKILLSGHEQRFNHFELERHLNASQPSPFEFEMVSKQQKVIPVLISSTCQPDQQIYTLFFQEITCVRQNQDRFDLMYKAISQTASAILITDPQGKIEYVNSRFTELTGYTEQELIGQNPNMLQSGSTEPETYQALWDFLLTTGKWQGELRNRRKNGEYYWANETISTITNEQGEITHLLAIEEDITQRKQAESALLESEQRFRQMAEMTGEWLWEQDQNGFYIYCSVAVRSILGFEPDEVIGKHYTSLLTPNDKLQKQTASLEQKPFYGITNYYRHRSGKQIITESTGLPIKDKFGKLIKWRGVDHDITARTHFQNALIDSEKRKRLIIESALNAIIIMDSYGIVTDWNIQAEKMFGWSHLEAIDKRLDELIIPERFRAAHRKGLEKFLRTEKGPILNHLIEHTAIRRNGEEFPVEISISPLKLGNAYIFSGFVHDISARKAAEKTIREAQVKMAITKKELDIAHQIQTSLLPGAAMENDQFEITGICVTADQVGGDYYDYFYQNPNHLDILIADVSGHSIGPALFMVETRSAVRTQASLQGNPAQTLAALNNVLFQDLYNADYFITLFYLQYNLQNQQLSYANAGHPTPLLFKQSTNKCEHLDADGLVIGVKKNIEFEQKTCTLQSGDMLLLYTDGLVEARNADGEFFGIERVCDTFINNVQLKPEGLISAQINALKTFCQRENFEDDFSLVVLKKK